MIASDPNNAASALLRAAGAAFVLMMLVPSIASAANGDYPGRVCTDTVHRIRTVVGGLDMMGCRRLWGGPITTSIKLFYQSGRTVVPVRRAPPPVPSAAAPAPLPDLPEGHSPEGALRRALVPGWGQIYNRQYYKLPFVYLGLGAFVGGVVWYNQQYLLHRHAALFRQWQEDAQDGELERAEPEWQRFEGAYREIAGGATNPIASSRIRQVRDNLRRNRDLLVIGSVLYYGLTIVDAYVSAHLVAFDVGEDLSAAVRLPFGERPVLAVRVRL